LKSQFATYKKVADNIHLNTILPIGKKPSGFSWTGFVSQTPKNQAGYLMIFRENTEENSFEFKIPGLESKVTFTTVLGDLNTVSQNKHNLEKITIQFDESFSYGLISFE